MCWIRVKFNLLMVFCTITFTWGWPHSFLKHVMLVGMKHGILNMIILNDLLSLTASGHVCFDCPWSRRGLSSCSHLGVALRFMKLVEFLHTSLVIRVSENVSMSSSILPRSPFIQTLPRQRKQRQDSTACSFVLLSLGKHPEAADGSTHR